MTQKKRFTKCALTNDRKFTDNKITLFLKGMERSEKGRRTSKVLGLIVGLLLGLFIIRESGVTLVQATDFSTWTSYGDWACTSADSSSADDWIEVTMKGDGYFMPLLRDSTPDNSANNGQNVRCFKAGSTCYVGQYYGGSETWLNSTSCSTTDGDVLRCEVSGNYIKFTKNGTTIVDYTGVSPSTAGKICTYTAPNSHYYNDGMIKDDYVVPTNTPTPEPPTPTPEPPTSTPVPPTPTTDPNITPTATPTPDPYKASWQFYNELYDNNTSGENGWTWTGSDVYTDSLGIHINNEVSFNHDIDIQSLPIFVTATVDFYFTNEDSSISQYNLSIYQKDNTSNNTDCIFTHLHDGNYSSDVYIGANSTFQKIDQKISSHVSTLGCLIDNNITSFYLDGALVGEIDTTGDLTWVDNKEWGFSITSLAKNSETYNTISWVGFGDTESNPRTTCGGRTQNGILDFEFYFCRIKSILAYLFIPSLKTPGSVAVIEEFQNFTSPLNTDLTDVILMPLGTIYNITQGTCEPLSIPLPYLDNQNVELPCFRQLMETNFATLVTLWDVITTGLISYYVILNTLRIIKQGYSPSNDKLEVQEI